MFAIKEKSVLFFNPDFNRNIVMYNYLINRELEYINFSNLNDIFFENRRYINILKIGNKYSLYICIKANITDKYIEIIRTFIAMIISDIVIINKVNNINKAMCELDVALDLGKDIYAIPGDIFNSETYVANFALKQGAIPICSRYDIKYILKEKNFNVL